MIPLFTHIPLVNSINHEYKEWNDKNTQLATCNKDTKNLPPGSSVPQEVDKDKEIVFTYDVSFKVHNFLNSRLLFLPFYNLMNFCLLPPPRRVISNGHLVGTHTSS